MRESEFLVAILPVYLLCSSEFDELFLEKRTSAIKLVAEFSTVFLPKEPEK